MALPSPEELFGALIEEVRFALDSPLEEAVSSEPVSESQFPASWEFTANFARFDPATRNRRKELAKSVDYSRIPYASEQGIYCGLAGN
jgi:hypothetical protein